ncbi:hypothetical protein [Nocardia terpenica]|uniref:Uncharacterized protein n=1 Tax=Nocardia terpenica TaxID=455432 RepID=A0A6G9ZCT4_9NOCA|nr:hypothetical protein [Nocardia terpenica]QIS23312.1 hypothetical protein F6W96_38240 [Nocardia terpenica]
MSDQELDTVGVRPVLPGIADIGANAASTPLRRAAVRLQAALPPGWEVDIVDVPRRPGQVPGPLLRVRMPEN